jgi:hypothetical protein
MNELLTVYGFCALGVVVSVVLPILREMLPKASQGITRSALWVAARPYVILGLFSLVVALLLVAFLQGQLTDWRAALLAGYSADSTLQKLKG